MGRKQVRKSELGTEQEPGPESTTDVTPEQSADPGMETEPEPEPVLARALRSRPGTRLERVAS